MPEKISILNQNKKKLKNTGLKLLYLGVFLLPTAPTISGLVLVISLIFSENNNPINFLKERSNKILTITSLLMILSCIYNAFDKTNLISNKTGYLSWISLINWIPFFWCFWGFQPYLKKYEERRRISKLLLVGTIPVIISGFLQYFIGINGPFEIFNGLIIWYQKPISITDGLTGPFSNANYAGSWLAIVWPFSIYFFVSIKKKGKKLITLIICFLFIISILLTNSRNSWLGMLISIQIVFGFETILLVIPLIITIAIITTFLVSLIPTSTRDFLLSIVPINIFNNFPDNSIPINEAFPRLGIWQFSLERIFERPIFGWGGGSFPKLYETFQGEWIGHSHNIIFEIAFNYGILTAVILSSTVTKYLKRFYTFLATHTKYKINKTKDNLILDRAWFASIIFITFSHLFDVQYFDLRISIMSWVLLAGLRAAMI